MTKQETFDLVCKALITQGGVSRGDEVGCMYRGPDGRKCAAGHLIPDDKYTPTLENKRVTHHDVYDIIASEGHDVQLVSELQYAHDGAGMVSAGDTLVYDEGTFINDFKKRARRVAKEFYLSDAVLE